MICYAFPLAHEVRDILKRCTQKESFSINSLHCTLGNMGARQVLIAEIGMGQAKARENTQLIFQYFRPKAFVLSGYGGALVSQLKVGQVLLSSNFSSEQLLPFLRLMSGFDFGVFATSDELAGTPEKRDWYSRSMQAQVVDMETAAVVDVVQHRAIPFLAVRVISDDYRTVLPLGALAAGFDAEKGQPTPMKLLKYLAMHPKEAVPLKDFVAHLEIARRSLTFFTEQLNAELPHGW